jgi:hypothetical protein
MADHEAQVKEQPAGGHLKPTCNQNLRLKTTFQSLGQMIGRFASSNTSGVNKPYGSGIRE